MTSSAAPSLSVENQKLHEENRALRATLLRSETELKIAMEALTRMMQTESNAMLDKIRLLERTIADAQL